MRNNQIRIIEYDNHLAIRVYLVELNIWREYPIYLDDCIDIQDKIKSMYPKLDKDKKQHE